MNPYGGGGAIKHIVTERDYCSTVTQVMDDGKAFGTNI